MDSLSLQTREPSSFFWVQTAWTELILAWGVDKMTTSWPQKSPS